MSFAVAKKPSPNRTHHKKPHSGDIAPQSLRPASALVVQPKANCAYGGDYPRCKGEIDIQPKLKIGNPNNQCEQEIDRVAEQVMRIPESSIQHKVNSDEIGVTQSTL